MSQEGFLFSAKGGGCNGFNFDLSLFNDKKVYKTGAKADSILRKEDNAYIPMDSANTDYQEYLEWVAEGNTAEAAD